MPVENTDTLDIHLRPSLSLSWIAITTYAAIAVSLCFANLPWWGLGGLWLALYLQAVMQWRRIRTPLPPFELTRLRWQNNQWSLTLDNTHNLYQNGIRNEILWNLIWLRTIPFFIFLRLQPVLLADSAAIKPRTLIIAKDQLNTHDYRKLLLWLHMRPLPNPE